MVASIKEAIHAAQKSAAGLASVCCKPGQLVPPARGRDASIAIAYYVLRLRY
jgi:hypothetical protein